MRHLGFGLLLMVGACSATGTPPAGVNTVRAVPRQTATRRRSRAAKPSSSSAPCRPRIPPRRSPAPAVSPSRPWSRVEFTSPAAVLLPDFGADSPNVTVTCRAGKQSGSGVAPPVAAWSGGAGGWPAVGISVGTGDVSGVGVGLGWWGGGGAGAGSGVAVTRYGELRIPLG